ncbi:uncharacterized protein LOC132922160 [Rhopalosiphum padi]|uniref:uncharacterized protein LOC132922160 n=1 Tax=Rhopalosiphum padi TaxID=40932 RepID=UPI00298E4538|nr:uncharacterized protein LOC132922160 [Rhopalosiphum padi]XP_060841500.1 uncharacterized protein LOC132922160 [Rhopalosiphum padi]
MEQENEANHLSKDTQKKNILVLNNYNHNQVTLKSIDNQEMQLNMTNSDLKIDPSTSSYEHVNSKSNNTSNSDIDNINQLREDFMVESSPSKVIKCDNSSEINFGVESEKKSITNKITNLENNHELLKNKSPIQFTKFKHTNFDILKSTEHAIKYKKSIETNFHCLICDTKIKSLKDWESHVISTFHIEECLNKHNYVSYDCGGCKIFFFGSKAQILKHCKDIHNDISGLPCVFRCMKEVFYHCIFVSPNNWKSWSFCGPCKSYSFLKLKCYSSNHIYKKTIHFKCNSCLIDFVCSQEVYNKHLMSCEHIMLEYLQSKKVGENLENQTICYLKLPPIILNKFSIDNIKSTCNDCKFQMHSNEEAITFHLTECINKSDIGEKNRLNIKTYFCEVCNITMPDYTQWKFHLILSSHLIKCYDIKDLVSYTCELCSLHCYGGVHHVTDHQNIHPNNSEKNLSRFMAFNFQRINNDLKTKDFYYCEECEIYAEVNSNSDHWNKSHKTKLKRIVCQPCRTEFFCIEDNVLFNKHILSSEHIILKSVAFKKLLPELKTQPLINQNLKPYVSKNTLDKNKVLFNVKPYLQFFQNVKNENNTMCKSCDNLINLNHNDLLSHLLVCNHGLVESIPRSNFNYFQCLECAFCSNNKDTWIKHATTTHAKFDTNICYSYICKSCNSLVYGKINDIELHLITEHKTTFINMPLESVLMAKQLMKKNNNVSKSSDIMCFCEPCNMIIKLSESPYHFIADSHASAASSDIELFYCKDCKVEFYSSITVYECHKLTAEHIIMSSDYRKTEVKVLLNPSKLDTHLFTFVTDQHLYHSTLNIGFFCFLCDYLCLKLDVWKIHINSKKHLKISKDLCIDHRCKVCKTLMFGTRHHMFEHYSNRFHSMLRQFKSTEVLKQKYETKQTSNMGTTFENNPTAVVNEKPGECSTTVNLLTEMMTKLSYQSNIHKESTLSEESTTNNTHPMTVNELPLELNFHQDSSVLDEPITKINETQLMRKTMDEFPTESNTQNYSTFYRLKINMLNEYLKQNKEITSQMCYYCVSCDFITTVPNNWDKHNLTDHSNEAELRHKVYCDVCNLYQFGLSHHLDEHFKTIEHKNMLDFKKLYNSNYSKKNNNKIKKKNDQNSNLTSGNPSDVTQISKIDKQQTDGSKIDQKEGNNRPIMIEVKGIKPQYKKNSCVEIKKIFSHYGLFGIITKHSSVIIIFRKLAAMNKMLNDKEILEKKYEFTINILIEDDKFPELHKTTISEFGNKTMLLKAINTQLAAINQEISNPDIIGRLFLLVNSIHSCAGQHFKGSKTYAFGSRMSGLALKDSDVDLYFDIADTFGGELSNDLYAQEDLVRYFGKVFRSQNNEFKDIQPITGARVPIVKFFHVPSGLFCDLSFKSGLSTHNTKLVRLYLALDERVHWIVCAVVKRWALQNDMKNQSMFTSYALAWLVLFYLMTIEVVPPLKLLREHADYSKDTSKSDVMFIEDWDCTFCSLEKAKQIWKVPEIPCWDLLLGFFKFYSDSNRLKQFVLCPAIGQAIPKDKFFDIPMVLPDILGFNKKKNGRPTDWCIRLRDNFHGEGLAVQDPFDLFHNITKVIIPRKLQNFSYLCNKTMEVMNNGVQPYYA